MNQAPRVPFRGVGGVYLTVRNRQATLMGWSGIWAGERAKGFCRPFGAGVSRLYWDPWLAPMGYILVAAPRLGDDAWD
ncbi:MAG: hypothetical protein JWN40_5218 [Phycisphaerales bacterium]|nr:hypothetical protein [Phycisphaerales bacterium]